MKKFKHVVLNVELEAFAKKCLGRSSADVIRLVQLASQFCMDKVLRSTLFVQHAQNRMLCLEPECEKWHPCLKVTPKCAPVKQDPNKNEVEFCVPYLTIYDLFAAFNKTSTTVDPYLLDDYVEFGKTLGLTIKEPQKKTRSTK